VVNRKKLLVIGAGGHARVVLDLLSTLAIQPVGALDDDSSRIGQEIFGVAVLGTDSDIAKFPATEFELVNAIGSENLPNIRQKIFEKFKLLGYSFQTLIHPSAVISKRVEIGEGCQIMAGATIQVGAKIGRNVLVNTKASIDHDCEIGDHCHIAPGATLSGTVKVGATTHIGTGVAVIQRIRIGSQVVVGAGSAVVRDLPDGGLFVGTPAQLKRRF
jgi:sugar O-acyltransferase (sialic acid O-acetyltransferase NeuD family)